MIVSGGLAAGPRRKGNGQQAKNQDARSGPHDPIIRRIAPAARQKNGRDGTNGPERAQVFNREDNHTYA
jgi:hypothetical protein